MRKQRDEHLDGLAIWQRWNKSTDLAQDWWSSQMANQDGPLINIAHGDDDEKGEKEMLTDLGRQKSTHITTYNYIIDLGSFSIVIF